jgi:hypothetical protein
MLAGTILRVEERQVRAASVFQFRRLKADSVMDVEFCFVEARRLAQGRWRPPSVSLNQRPVSSVLYTKRSFFDLYIGRSAMIRLLLRGQATEITP